MLRALRLHSWDVFTYELLPNQLRALRLLLGQFSSGQRQPIIRRASRLHSWDVFAYELLPNQLRALRLLLGQFSSGQRQPIIRRASRLHSWDAFAYESLPNQLRPVSLPLGRLSKIIQDVDWAVKGLNYILWFIHRKSALYPQGKRALSARFSRLLARRKILSKKLCTGGSYSFACMIVRMGNGMSMPSSR